MTSAIKAILLFLFLASIHSSPLTESYAQTDVPIEDIELSKIKQSIAQDKEKLDSLRTKTKISEPTFWTHKEMFFLSTFTLIFGLTVLLIVAFLIYRRVENTDSDSLLRVFLTPLIIISAVYLVVVGYSEKQISPVIGLLGTIAGYLLGQQKSSKEIEKNSDGKKSE